MSYLGYLLRESYPSAEMQSMSSAAPTDWAIFFWTDTVFTTKAKNKPSDLNTGMELILGEKSRENKNMERRQFEKCFRQRILIQERNEK